MFAQMAIVRVWGVLVHLKLIWQYVLECEQVSVALGRAHFQLKLDNLAMNEQFRNS